MPQIYGKVATNLPSEGAEGSFSIVQVDEYGAQATRQEQILWAEQGTYFKATNPTPGTGIVMGVQASFSDTSNVLLMFRNGSTTKKVIPHYIKLICTAAGTAATSSHYAITIDTINRYSAGGTDLLAQVVNANSTQTVTSIIDVLRYNFTANAPVARRLVGRGAIKTQVAPAWVIGDEFKLIFGSDADHGPISGAAPTRYVSNVGPIILGAQNHCMLMHVWNVAGSAAPAFEFEIAWWER